MHGFFLLASATGPNQNVSIFDPASPPTESIRALFILVLAVTGAIFLLVEVVLVYSIFRFRGQTADSIEPPQVYGSLPIEIAWTAAPLLIVFLLALILTRTEFEVRVNPDQPPPGSKPLYVTVIGRQWWWEYIYDKYDGQDVGVITANELHVPASEEGIPRPVYLTLKSADVCHSFWVPRLAGKTDLIPGRTNQMWFQASQPGLYVGQCAEYCGTQHAHMLLRVNVESSDDFQHWLDNQKKPTVEDAAVRAGREVFFAQSCINCHRVNGTPAKGTYGPDLTHLMSRQTLASGMVANTRAELRRWVSDPQQIKEGCLMPAFGLNEQQVDLLVNYLLSLK
ncbi:MAG TPA: cytochrome c oxidase subunit II [Gemmataceae bacterium]|nr:cytochrome c oxidase subunit II [Gemmataceae bacterium]